MGQRMLTALLIAPVIAGMGAAPALGQATATVTANPNDTFSPTPVTITAGGSVTFTNAGGSHDVHFNGEAPLNAVAGPSPTWGVTKTFATPGTFTYVCDLHASIGMTGTITVTAAPAGGPAPVTPAPSSPVPGAPAPTSPALDTVAPRATRVSGSATLRRATVRLRLSEGATVVARLTRRGSTRTLTRTSRSLAAGSHSVTLRRRLTAGARYSVLLRITDAAGNVTRRTVSLTAHG